MPVKSFVRSAGLATDTPCMEVRIRCGLSIMRLESFGKNSRCHLLIERDPVVFAILYIIPVAIEYQPAGFTIHTAFYFCYGSLSLNIPQ